VADTAAERLEVVRTAGSWDEQSLRLLLRCVELLAAQGRDAEARAACIEVMQNMLSHSLLRSLPGTTLCICAHNDGRAATPPR